MFAVFDRYRRQRSPAFATPDEAQAWLARHPQRYKVRVRMCNTELARDDQHDPRDIAQLRLYGCIG